MRSFSNLANHLLSSLVCSASCAGLAHGVPGVACHAENKLEDAGVAALASTLSAPSCALTRLRTDCECPLEQLVLMFHRFSVVSLVDVPTYVSLPPSPHCPPFSTILERKIPVVLQPTCLFACMSADNRMGPLGAAQLASALVLNTCLKALHLSRMAPMDRGLLYCVRALCCSRLSPHSL